ncbi:unnamed protein product [Hapterophycus canaliculatus]
MAFFGLTALGPQNCFQVSLLDYSYLDVFTESDMQNAFNIVDQAKRSFLKADQIEAFLTELYHGKPKDCDLVRFMERMAPGEGEENRLTLDVIRSGMAQLKKEVEEEANQAKWHRGSGSDFNSNQSFRETVRRHEYIARGPRERYAGTVTAVQEHGWQDQLDTNKQVVHGKKSCPETVYASELVKSGVYF